MPIIIETERLILRTWKSIDIEIYHKINQNPKVLEFLPGALSMAQTIQSINNFNLSQKQYAYSLWAAVLKKTDKLIGFIGLNNTNFLSHFTPAIEIAWRLDSIYWGNGYATEGAKASLNYAKKHNLKNIVSFTVPSNIRSIRVMEKIGLQHDIRGTFSHPKLPEKHPLCKHVLYRYN